MPTTAAPLIGGRYVLHASLGQGGMGIVYHALDRLTGQTVALKRVLMPATEEGTPTTDSDDLRLGISREFRTLASLRHPNIIGVIDYGFDTERQPYFTMDLLTNPQTFTAAARPADLSGRVRLLVDTLRALVYVHRRGVVHRDLKPANVLVDAEGRVKVLDFGLALQKARVSATDIRGGAAGTIAYMAPELFKDEEATPASDLYAVGLLTYELFVGRLPYNDRNVGLLLNDILNKTPDCSMLDGDLALVLERLLAKTPAERYPNAEAVIAALCEATGQPIPEESAEVRESFLQGATFVGREGEFGQLREALAGALTGKGSAWLVGGESGVGKSRLLEETRTRALVKGALVLRGQALAEGGLPYQVWREPLRRLILSTTLDDWEASVLKALVTDIDSLLEHHIPDAPSLDAQASQNRMLALIVELLRRQNLPVMVILEDLQWAGSENLTVLERLKPLVAELPLLIIGSYRDDERPDLPDRLAGMQLLRLKRLSDSNIAALSESMLGEAGRLPHVLDLLKRETEGNTFFLVEVVRALAERAGKLDKIGEVTLQGQLVAEGMQNIIQRRLNRIPTHARPLLQLAAVMGRELDLDVLRVLSRILAVDNEPSGNGLEVWLADCANAAVLEVYEDRWRFAHDKLREGTLSEIGAEKLPSLHLRIAQTIEQVHPNSPQHALALGRHYQQAEIHDKAARYLHQAADLARSSFANAQAIGFYRGAIEQGDELLRMDEKADVWRSEMAVLHESLGDVLTLTGKGEDARNAYQEALGYGPQDDIICMARLHRKISITWSNKRQGIEALQALAQAETSLGELPPTGMAKEWQEEKLQIQIEGINAHYWMAHVAEMTELVEKVRAVIDVYGTPMQRAQFFQGQMMADFRRNVYVVTHQTLEYSSAFLKASQEADPYSNSTVWAQFALGFTYLWRGDLDEADDGLQAALSLAERIGDTPNLVTILAYRSALTRKRGDVEETQRRASLSLAAASAAQVPVYIGIAKATLAWVFWRKGNLTEAQQNAQAAIECWQGVASMVTPWYWMPLWPLIGIALGEGQIAEAIGHIRTMLAPEQNPPPPALKARLEAVLQAWQQSDEVAATAQLQETCQLARQGGYL